MPSISPMLLFCLSFGPTSNLLLLGKDCFVFQCSKYATHMPGQYSKSIEKSWSDVIVFLFVISSSHIIIYYKFNFV